MIEVLKAHLESVWPKCDKKILSWELGPINQVLPEFKVFQIAPVLSQEPWIYLSVGASRVFVNKKYSVEFFVLAPDNNARHIETLAIVTYFHMTAENSLDLGRIVNCGRPWLDSSKCEHLLVSLPYPFGPSIEWCRNPFGKDIRLFWLLPITSSEARYANEFGIDRLERLFEQIEIDAIDPRREAVV